MGTDTFRPRSDPARAIYDAFQQEALRRGGRDSEDWMRTELGVVWCTARDEAQKRGLRVLTMAEVMEAEQLARGHVDYGAQWAYGVVERLERDPRRPREGAHVTTMALTDREQAAWLLGYVAARGDKLPRGFLSGSARSKADRRAAYRRALLTAQEVLNGGAFNPLSAWEMFRFVDDLRSTTRTT